MDIPSTSRSIPLNKVRDKKQDGNYKDRKRDQFRNKINLRFQHDLDLLNSLFRETFNFSLLLKGESALRHGDLDGFASVILALKSECVNVTLDISVNTDLPKEAEEEPISTLPLHTDNVMLRFKGIVDVALKEDIPVSDRCDPAICESCEPLPADGEIEVDSTSVTIYAGPGSGKTTLVQQLPEQVRGSVYDTDHLKSGFIVPPHSVVLTNRPDVLMKSRGLRIAFIPYMRYWCKLCLTKCPAMKQTWFQDLSMLVKNCFIIRRNSYLSECVHLRSARAPRKRNRPVDSVVSDVKRSYVS